MLHLWWSVQSWREPRKVFPDGFPLAAQPLPRTVGGFPWQMQCAREPQRATSRLCVAGEHSGVAEVLQSCSGGGALRGEDHDVPASGPSPAEGLCCGTVWLCGRRASVSAGQPAPSVRTAVRSALQTPESGAPRAPFLDAAWLFEYRACRHDSALSKYSC